MIYLILFFIGIANSLPIPLTGSTLSIWLIENGYSKEAIGLFALTSIPFSLKVLWIPIIDLISLPFFKRAPRKGWLIVSFLAITSAIFGLSLIQPKENFFSFFLLLLALSAFSGCLYVVGICYEMESLFEKQYRLGSTFVISGYRIGLLMGGAIAIYLSLFIDWQWTFRLLAFLLLLGGMLICFQKEPFQSKEIIQQKRNSYLKYHNIWIACFQEVIIQPSKVFFQKQKGLSILLFIFFFKCSDQLIKCMESPFFLSLGFTKIELATAAKAFGMVATICGAFFMSAFMKNKSALTLLSFSGFFHSCSFFSHYFLALNGKSILGLYLLVSLEHFTAGMTMACFIYFLWKVCDKKYAAIQYALLWSFFSLKASLLAALGGYLASILKWDQFFLISATCGFIFALIFLYVIVVRPSSGLLDSNTAI